MQGVDGDLVLQVADEMLEEGGPGVGSVAGVLCFDEFQVRCDNPISLHYTCA